MMIKTSRFALLLVVLVLQARAQDELVLRVFDVEGVTRAAPKVAAFEWSLLVREAYRSIESGFEDSAPDEEAFAAGADMLVRMLRDTVAPESWELEGRFMRLNETGTRLFVRQTRSNIDKVADFLRMHATVQGRSVTVEALVLAGGAAELAGLGGNRHIVSSERFELIRSGAAGMPVLATLSGSVRDGRLLVLRSGSVHHFLALQAGQIAQTAATSEPREGKIFAGSEVLVRPLLAADGRINLRIQSRLGAGLVFETWRSRSAGVGPLQLPSIRQSLSSSSVMLGSGEAVVLGATGSGDAPARFLLLRATTAAEPDPVLQGSRHGLRALRCGYLFSNSLSLPRLDLGHLGGGGRLYDDFEGDDTIFSSDYGYLSPESLMDLVRQNVTPDFWDENRYVLEPENTRLWIAAGEEQQRGIEALVRDLGENRARFLDVEAFCIRIDRRQLEALRKADRNDWLRELLRSPQALRLHAMVGSVEVGARIEFAEGLERAWVAESEADVAQGADIQVPSVETGFRGLYLRLAPYEVGDDGIGLDFEYDLTGPSFELKALEESVGVAADLRMATAGWSKGRGHALLGKGRYELLAEAASDSPDASLLIVVRLR